MRLLDLQVLNDNIFATFCANLINISPATPEITRKETAAFGTRRQKSEYPTKYLSKYGTIVAKFSASVDYVCWLLNW